MMDNSFEKQIRDKVNQAEVSPADGLLDAIFEKRAARPKPFLGLGYTKLFLLTAVVAITASVWFFNAKDSGSQETLSANSQSEQTSDAIASDSKPSATNADLSKSADNCQENSGTTQKTVVAATEKAGTTKTNRAKSGRTNRNSGSSKAIVSNSDRAINKIKGGFYGKPSWANTDPSSYFDVDAANRPVIDYESHNGNSHLFVYETVDPQLLESEILRYTGTSRIEKMQYPFAFDAFSPVKTEKSDYHVGKSNQHPFFIDLLFGNVYSTVKTQGAAVNALRNGTYNQQAGIRVSVPLKGKMSVFAGLGYMNQIVHYRGDYIYNEAYTNINTKVRFINDPIRGVIRVETKDTVSGIAARSKAVDFKNTYSLFRLPIGLGYNFGVGKFDFTLYGSADLNLLTYAKVHTMLNEANALVKTSDAKSLHLGAGMSFMTAYRISPRFRLIAEPGISYMRLKGASTGNFTNEKIYNFTATLGLRYSVF